MDAGEFWSIGDYALVGELWGQAGRDLAATLNVAGIDVIDLATGTGATAIAMARLSARRVVGVDAAPKLLTEAARRADTERLDIDWVEADMASVPQPDRSVDLVTSTFGLIFAEDPAAVLAECKRLVRPGGRIVFTSWSGTGLFGKLRHTLSPYFPDALEPWHETIDGLRSIVGDRAEVDERSFVLTVASAEDFVSMLEHHSAPFILGAEALGDRWTEARADLILAVDGAGHTDDDGYRADVRYLVTTIDVA